MTEIKKIKARGLRALIPLNPKRKSKKRKENIYYVEIKKIRLTPHLRASEGQVDKKTLDDLIDSVKKFGVVQPLTLAKVEKKKNSGLNVYYRLVFGQKRLLAAKAAGLRVVPAVIRKTASNDKI